MGRRPFDEQGGVWIVTGWVLGLLVYAGVILMYVAGFTPVLPLVVLPPVVLGLIAAGNLLGGRDHGRRPSVPTSGPAGPGGSATRAPLSSSGPNGTRPTGGPTPDRLRASEEPRGPA
jgi:hypothetical protein